MNKDEIKDAIGIDGIEVRPSENGHYWFVSNSVTINGQAHSWSIRLVQNPSPVEIDMVRTAFQMWEAKEESLSDHWPAEVLD